MESQKKLEVVIAEGEGYLVEFKESLNNIEKEICAFANASGGTIYVGVTDDGNIRKIKLSNELKSQIQNMVRSLEPNPIIELESVSGAIAIHVRESDNKPIKSSQGFFLRVGANSQKLTRDEIFQFAIKESRIKFDEQLYVEAPATKLVSIPKVEWFRRESGLEQDLEPLQLLTNLGVIKWQKGSPYLTQAGILLFAEEPQKIFPQAMITLLHMQDEAKITEQKILKGTVFEQVRQAFQFIMERLHTRIEIRSLKRQSEPEIPEYVIRELLVNAVVHRDYFETAAEIAVKIFPNMIEISNPGTLLHRLPLEKIYGKSYRRNPLLADLFFHAGYIERAGTGLLRVKKALFENDLPPLVLEEEGPFFIVRIIRQSKTLSKLNDRQKEFLARKKTGAFTTEEYARHFSISGRMARNDIQDFLKKGLAEKIRKQREIFYRMIK